MARSSESADAWGDPTRWTLVLRAADADAQVRGEALRELIELYAAPIRACARRRLRGHAEADQAADDFLADLLLRDVLPRADPSLGRFRCFMQATIRNFAREWLRDRLRRPRSAFDELSHVDEKAEFEIEREEERIWTRHWVERALARIEATHARDARLLEGEYGLRGAPKRTRADLRRELGIAANALEVALSRARRRLQAALRDELRPSVASESDLDEELRCVLERLGE